MRSRAQAAVMVSRYSSVTGTAGLVRDGLVRDGVHARAEDDAVPRDRRRERQLAAAGLRFGQVDGRGQGGVLVEPGTDQGVDINRGHGPRLESDISVSCQGDVMRIGELAGG